MNKIKTSKIWKINKDTLEEYVSISSSLNEVLKNIGLRVGSSNIETLKKRLDIEHIDYLKLINIPVSNGDIFVENSPYARNLAKRRILKENLIQYKCAICGQNDCWNGKELVLVLDHINGINNDHRLENLRFLCSNCNSQQSTFAGGNVKKCKKEWYCINCGKKISKGSLRCRKCNSATRIIVNIAKEQLQNDLKQMPLTSIAKKYGISDNGIRKWCKKYKLPYKFNDIKRLY